MSETLNRQWLMTSRPRGMVSRENFTWQETPVPPVGEGQFLVKNLYMSFDPTLRVWMNAADSYVPAIKIGEVMRCTAVGEVVASRHPDFAQGEFVLGGIGWQDYLLSDGKGLLPMRKVPPGMPLTMSLSVLGLTGVTAYFGMLDIGRVREGDVVVVSGAAGATGSIAAQIARLKGARVIGIAGGGEKCAWLRETARLDEAIDYKRDEVAAKLDEYCPDGIDVYYDNVGGELLDEVLARMAINARIVLCGAISAYNASSAGPGLRNHVNLIVQRGTMQGFIVLDFARRFPEAIAALADWVKAGDIAYQEDIQEGLENAPEVFMRIFTGKNRGKQLLKVAEPGNA